MSNLTLPETLPPDGGDFVPDALAAWTYLNEISRDTGVRDLSGLLVNGWTLGSSGYLTIRRIGDEVTIAGFNLDGSSATDPTLLNFSDGTGGTVSIGFRPQTDGVPQTHCMSPLFYPESPFALFFYTNNLRTRTSSGNSPISTSGPIAFQWTYKTVMSWPTSLPPAV